MIDLIVTIYELIKDKTVLKPIMIMLSGVAGGPIGNWVQNFQVALGISLQIASLIAIVIGAVLSYYKIKELRKKM